MRPTLTSLAIIPEDIFGTKKHGDSSIMHWGCFSPAETGALIGVKKIKNSSKCQPVFCQGEEDFHLSAWQRIKAHLQLNKAMTLLKQNHSF